MSRLRHRSTVLSSIGFFTAVAFAGCSGLDDREVTRGSDGPAAGTSPGGEGNGAGGAPSSGGAPGGQSGEGPNLPPGGDSSAGGTPPDPSGPLEVTEVAPADGEVDVEPTSKVALTFSRELASESVTPTHIAVLDDRRPVTGDLAYKSATATFEPSARLSLLATYDVKVSTGVTDTTGEPLPEAFTSKFTVRDGSWARQSSVTVDPANVGAHATGVDAEGNVLVVYTRPADATVPKGPRTVAARWIPPSRNAGDEELLEDNGDDCSGVQVAVDASGNAFALWRAYQGGSPVLRGRRFLNGSWERAPQNIVPEGAIALVDDYTSSAVGIGGGQVVAAWVRNFDLTSFVMEYTSTSLDGAFERPTTYQKVTQTAPNYESFDGVQAVVDAQGTILTTFAWHSKATVSGMYFARRVVGRSWETPVKIPASNPPAAQGGPALVSDGAGAMAVWFESVDSTYRLRASRYDRSRQFAEPVEIGDPRLTTSARLESPGGLATNGKSYWVTWTQTLDSAQNAYVTRYDVATSTWDAAPQLVSDGVARTTSATIGVDGHDNVLVAYDQSAANDTSLVFFARYGARARRWSTPTALTDAGTYFERPLLSVADNGVASVFLSSSANVARPSAKDTAGSYRIFK